MKKITLFFTSLAVFGFLASQLMSFSGGAPAGRSGSPINSMTCKSQGCHANASVDTGPAIASITTDIPAAGFVAGQTYTVTVKIADAGKTRFAFESVAYGNNITAGTGTVGITDANKTQMRAGSGAEFVTHKFAGIAATDSTSWSYDWTAPGNETDVTFYSVIMASNNNSNPGGDAIYTKTNTVTAAPGTGIEELYQQLSASAFPNPATDQLTIEMETTTAGLLHIQLTDLSGKIVRTESWETGLGNFSQQLDLHGLNTGIYILGLQKGNIKAHQKIIVND